VQREDADALAKRRRDDQCVKCHGLFLDPGEFERLMAAEQSALGQR
jgi:Zn-finger nucleic acid-binding protein